MLSGYFRSTASLETHLEEVCPAANRFEQIDAETYITYDASNTLKRYITVGVANGYGVPLQAAVGVAPEAPLTTSCS